MTDRSIGEIIQQNANLTADQVERVLAFQRQHGARFGEAAVALGFVKRDEVLWALSQQFDYPYSSTHATTLQPELVVATQPFGPAAEVFRDLRSQLITSLYVNDLPRRALAVVSPQVGDGKSYFAANIAIAFSQLGGRTLLIDADLRSPRQHEIFGIANDVGLSALLSGRTDSNVICSIDELPSLYVMPVGALPPNPSELVQRPAFPLLLNELLSKFDHVIVDTPAAAHGSDARTIAGACRAALLVNRKGESRMDETRKLITSIQKTSASVLGVVLNDH
jgi:protein-tyrosine kinase